MFRAPADGSVGSDARDHCAADGDTAPEDRFGRQSAKYAQHRPRYPDELFEWLAGLCPRRDLAWDCATGSGQAALGLARHFAHVRATDVSARQIAHAPPHPGISYAVAPAHDSGLPDAAVDLVTVATALHWLNLDELYGEVKRVLAGEGVFAAWAYRDNQITPAVDAVLRRFREEIVGGDWAFDMTLLTERYRTIPFPFREIPVAREFAARTEWSLADVFGYLDSWSATQRYRDRTGRDPVALIKSELAAAWGDPATRRVAEWPLFMRVGRYDQL